MGDDVRGQVLKDFLIAEMNFLGSLIQIENMEKNIGCVDGRIIGTGCADYTQESTMYNLKVANKSFAFIDIPGIEGDEGLYEKIIRQSLEKAHAIFYVNGSGKKIEKSTLEKIKKYMRDGTSVYALFNVHCKAKKNRVAGIDKSFSEELYNQYEKAKEIIDQTEEELKSFLLDNYKDSISLNGLLAFCSLAFNDIGETSIVDEQDKNLRKEQLKYMKEYSNDVKKMLIESKIQAVEEVINRKVDTYEKDICYENIKKLRKRLSDMISKIEDLKKAEDSKIKGFVSVYDDFISNCLAAKEDYIYAIEHVALVTVEDSFVDVKNKLFEMIEKNRGKTNVKDIKCFFDIHKREIIDKIQNGVNSKFIDAQNDYQKSIAEAQNRLMKDVEREQIKFEVSLSTVEMKFDDSFQKMLKYNIKDLGKDLFATGGLAWSGATVGSSISPGIGTIVGAAVGAMIGFLSSVWYFFASESSRVNSAKEKIQRMIDDQIYQVSESLKNEIEKLEYDVIINNSYNQICECANKQKEQFRKIDVLLNEILNHLKMKQEELRRRRVYV